MDMDSLSALHVLAMVWGYRKFFESGSSTLIARGTSDRTSA